jgi:hypothetical protein
MALVTEYTNIAASSEFSRPSSHLIAYSTEGMLPPGWKILRDVQYKPRRQIDVRRLNFSVQLVKDQETLSTCGLLWRAHRYEFVSASLADGIGICKMQEAGIDLIPHTNIYLPLTQTRLADTEGRRFIPSLVRSQSGGPWIIHFHPATLRTKWRPGARLLRYI